MGIRFGRSLQPGRRPAAPKPRLGDLAPDWQGGAVARQKRKKANEKKIKRTSKKSARNACRTDKRIPAHLDLNPSNSQASNLSGGANPCQTAQAQRTPSGSLQHDGQPQSKPPSTRVVVIWVRDGFRYVAWGTKGVKEVEGWKKCRDDSEFRKVLSKLGASGIRLIPREDYGPVAEILDLMIMSGKVLKPKLTARKPRQNSSVPSSSRAARSRSSVSRQPEKRRGEWRDLSRHEALVARPADGIAPKSQRKKKARSSSSRQSQRGASKLEKQRHKSQRLGRIRNEGSDTGAGHEDLMHRALQGGSPGLKR